ncbi:hypothetical protein ACFLW8_06350 [Chloroflexota bacterium]
MSQWEYLVVDTGRLIDDTGRIGDEGLQELFNSFGFEGWELVAVTETATGVDKYDEAYYDRMAYFKRWVS